MFAMPAIPPKASYLFPEFLDQAFDNNITANNTTVSLELDIGAAADDRHILFLVSHTIEERDQDQSSTGLSGTFSVDGVSVTQIAEWETSQDYLSWPISSVFGLYYATVPTGTTCTANITPSGYDLNEVKHVAAYRVKRQPIVVNEVKTIVAPDSGTITLSPTYANNCMLIGMSAGVLNNGLFNSERLQSSIGVTEPADASQCSVKIPNATNTSGAYQIKNYAGTSIEVSHSEHYRNTNYPYGRTCYAVTLR